jgi:subtilase family serine protease
VRGAPAELSVSSIIVRGYLTPPPDCGAGDNIVMVEVRNTGAGNADSFLVQLIIDGVQVDDQQKLDELGPGEVGRAIFDSVALSEGAHVLTANADTGGQVAETDESANSLSRAVTCVMQ